ncbi:MAG: hypothetical protein JWP16_788 [Alphaproteobacteria bacterium]|nr:hypothetical protein [Alphaproteobacteria bacterium]MDB5739748.1 hypothetical protein [Alphaproteobacteria bacterium]
MFGLFCVRIRFYMVGQSGERFGTDLGLLATTLDIPLDAIPGVSLAHPFLRPGRPLTPADQRREAAKRTVSWVLVIILHLLIIFGVVISIRPFSDRTRPMTETILTLDSAGHDSTPQHIINPDVDSPRPPVMMSAPIIIPKPPPIPDIEPNQPAVPGDILGAVGRTLACSAGNWEHLTTVERRVCLGLGGAGVPWRGMRLPNGNLVLVPPSQLSRLKEAPPQTFDLNTGADRIQRDLQNGQIPGQGGCPILQQMPCTHVTPGYRNMNGEN